MRLGALLGNRNGHSGVFPLGRHPDPLRFYPVRTYEFEDGTYVVSAANPELVGAELLAIDDIDIADIAALVAPLVPHDNAASLRARRPQYLTAAEVLQGLGVVDGTRASFRIRKRGRGPTKTVCEPVSAPAYVATVDSDIRLPPARHEPRLIERVGDGSILLVVYNETRGETESFAAAVAGAAGRGLRAVILDLRRNGGGDNSTYGPLLDQLCRCGAERPLFVLISRATFSAAMQLVVDLERQTDAVFVGEATGGSPNQFGDAVDVDLPATELVARVATIHWQTAGEEDERLTREPDLPIPLTSNDYFGGRDPVLAGAIDAAA
jgi:C-terminal processing protease CtpA/Prc